MSLRSLRILPLTALLFASVSTSAGTSVVDGQLIDDHNQVITLRVASRALVIPVPDPSETDDVTAADANAIRGSLTAPGSVELPAAGGDRTVKIGVSGFNGEFTVTVPTDFKLRYSGTTLTFSADKNTGGYKTDAVFVTAKGARGRIRISQRIALWQRPLPGNAAKYQPPPEAFTDSAMNVTSASTKPASTDVQATMRGHVARGGNAVRVVLPLSSTPEVVASGLVGVIEACQQHHLWCLVDASAEQTEERLTREHHVYSTVQYLTQPAIQAALYGHEDHVMLVVRKPDLSVRDVGTELKQLRAAGLSHVVLLSVENKQPDAATLRSASALLDQDPYRAVALLVSTTGLQDATNVGKPAIPIVEAATACGGGVKSDGTALVVARNGVEILSVPYRRLTFTGRVYGVDCEVEGSYDTLKVGTVTRRPAGFGFFDAQIVDGKLSLFVPAQPLPPLPSVIRLAQVQLVAVKSPTTATVTFDALQLPR